MQQPDLTGPVEFAKGIFWVGCTDHVINISANPYLIVEGEEAVLIDGGSRPHFSEVMMKVLQTGINLDHIRVLIFHHYDPDLCGAVYNFAMTLKNPDLKIISQRANHAFIRYYGTTLPLLSLEDVDHCYTFASGRKLTFIETRFVHAAGSFVTFDNETGTLLSSDLFGSFHAFSKLYAELKTECYGCDDPGRCERTGERCLLKTMIDFHEKVMPSHGAFQNSIKRLAQLPIKNIASQHGCVIIGEDDCRCFIRLLTQYARIGIEPDNA